MNSLFSEAGKRTFRKQYFCLQTQQLVARIYILKECDCGSDILTEVNFYQEFLKHTKEGAMNKN